MLTDTESTITLAGFAMRRDTGRKHAKVTDSMSLNRTKNICPSMYTKSRPVCIVVRQKLTLSMIERDTVKRNCYQIFYWVNMK